MSAAEAVSATKSCTLLLCRFDGHGVTGYSYRGLASDDKLLEQARDHPSGLSFNEFERLLGDSGWRLVRQRGSHRVWRSPAGHMLPVQPRGKDAKSYQVKQFLKQYDKEKSSGSQP